MPQVPADATQVTAPDIGAASHRREAREAAKLLSEPPLLPPVESLDAASDITPFLAPGVPAELTRQALRKAWQSDPAIRDFVGLAENSWDFNAPDGVPGFGSLSQEEVRQLVEGVIGKPDPVQPSPETARRATAELPPAAAAEPAPVHIEASPPVAATQSARDAETPRVTMAGRRHGSALPQ